jgi:osmotically-inducible protein OsmY
LSVSALEQRANRSAYTENDFRALSRVGILKFNLQGISGGKMKFKLLTVFGAAVLLASACGGGANTNVNNANANRSNNTAVVTATTAPPAMDAATKTVVDEAMKKKGYTDVTVEATTAGVTLRGSVPKGKMAEAVQAAQEAGKKPVKNELTEK